MEIPKVQVVPINSGIPMMGRHRKILKNSSTTRPTKNRHTQVTRIRSDTMASCSTMAVTIPPVNPI